MQKCYKDEEEDKRACAGVREDFKACLLQYDCVVKEGKMPSQCLKDGHCKALQTSSQGQGSEKGRDIKEPSKQQGCHVVE